MIVQAVPVREEVLVVPVFAVEPGAERGGDVGPAEDPDVTGKRAVEHGGVIDLIPTIPIAPSLNSRQHCFTGCEEFKKKHLKMEKHEKGTGITKQGHHKKRKHRNRQAKEA